MIPNPETIKEKMYECDNIKNILHIRKNTNKITSKDKMGEKISNLCNREGADSHNN